MLTPVCTNQVSVNHRDDGGTIVAIRCKRWSCTECAPINRRQVIKDAVDGQPTKMLTLTVSSKKHPDATEAAAALKRGLRLLRLHLKRHPKFQPFEFMAVFEAHKSGHPHLHLLIRGGFIPWKWLTKTWRKITGSTHVDIRKIKGSKDAARYVAKYLGKDLHAFEGCKRWWRSRGYQLQPKTAPEPKTHREIWQRFDADYNQLLDDLDWVGYSLKISRPRCVEYDPPPKDAPTPIEIIWHRKMLDQGDYWSHVDKVIRYSE